MSGEWTMRFHPTLRLAAQRGPRHTTWEEGDWVGICSLSRDGDPDSPLYTIQGDGDRTPRWLSGNEAKALASGLGMEIEGVPEEVIEGTAVDITEGKPTYGEGGVGMGPM